jgi:RNase_H superfamily
MASEPKIAVWDLETSDLKANKGFIFCGAVCDPLDMSVDMYRIDSYKGYKRDLRNDRDLVVDLVRDLSGADLWVTYYGKRFDLPFLNSRILYWRQRGVDVPHLENVPHIDLYDTARRKLALHSNRLASVSAFLGNTAKTSVDLALWMDAAYGNKEALEHIVDHCQDDVITLAEDYLDLRPLIRAHPHLGLLSGGDKLSCGSCGSEKTQKRGVYVTESTKRQRLYCQECGKWSSIPYRDIANKNNKKKAVEGGASSNQPSEVR